MSMPSMPADAASTPCPWTLPVGAPCCTECSGWDSASPELQAVAVQWATTFLWAATGRRFNECQVQVRPCGAEPCQDGSLNYYGWGWSGGTWIPYIWNGNWFNCSCNGRCTCTPMSEIRLIGPVIEILEITLGGDIIDPDTYWVDNGHWLVRKGPDRWPECNDLNSLDGDDVLTVTYLRGDPVPDTLRYAAKVLACEYIKSCNQDKSCRLSSYVTSVSRAGVDFTLIPLTELLDQNLTGIPLIDQTIRFYNPYGLRERHRILAPELRYGRVTSWP